MIIKLLLLNSRNLLQMIVHDQIINSVSKSSLHFQVLVLFTYTKIKKRISSNVSTVRT